MYLCDAVVLERGCEGAAMTVVSARLGDLVSFCAGRNQSRSARSGVGEKLYYTQSDFEDDLANPSQLPLQGDFHLSKDVQPSVQVSTDKKRGDNRSGELVVHAGDIVISTFTYYACLVSEANAGKTLSHKYMRVDCIDSALLKSFFLYLFNEDRKVQLQKKSVMQGEIIKRLPLTALAEIRVPLPSQGMQERIGNAYMSAKRLSYATKRQACLVEDFSMIFLNVYMGGLK